MRLNSFYGMAYSTLFYLCEAIREADAKAFRALMRHIREVDGDDNTVVVVQVENETGLMGAGREHSEKADALFGSPVPQDFVDYMKAHINTMAQEVRDAVKNGKTAGTWSEVFGDWAEEMFSAYHVAGYVNAVAAAGKEEYPLPMAANCWLDKGEEAGKFPTGGPVSRVMEVWHYCAPNIDIIAPDIYVPDFVEICDEYTRWDNPLFIAETATHSYAGPRELYAVGHYHAMCYSPFGFEEMGMPFSAQMGFLFGMDTSDPALQTPQNTDEYAWYTNTLNSMMPHIAARYGTDDLQAVMAEHSEEDTMIFGSFGFRAVTDTPFLTRKDGVCLIMQESEDTFYIVANGCGIEMFSTDAEKPYVDVLVEEDGHFENGEWKACRRLNGDEISISMCNEPVLLKVKLFAYC